MSATPLSWILASSAGITTALIWLWFWLREDKARPEPRGRLILTFLAGMFAVLVVLPLEKSVQLYLPAYSWQLLTSWAIIEEVIKFVFAWIAALHAHDMDEPIDAVIYMITAALGFAALENALFLLTPLGEGAWLQTIITGNLRFIGATVLHTLASAIVGIFIAFSFYKNKYIRKRAIILGLILAISLHALFNLLIIKSTGIGMIQTFGYVWLGIVILLIAIEKVKRIKPNK